MCGTESGKLMTAIVEGVELNLCSNCASFGKVVNKPSSRSISKRRIAVQKKERELVLVVNQDFARIIREKRERMGLKQKEFAKFLNEKESLIPKIESGTYVPPISMARKLEKQLGIELVEQQKIEPQELKSKKTEFTIGDMIKTR